MKQNLYALVLAPVFKMLVNSSQKYKTLRCLLHINFFTLLIIMTAGNINADTVKKFEPVSLAVVDFRGVLAKSKAAVSVRKQLDINEVNIKKNLQILKKN